MSPESVSERLLKLEMEIHSLTDSVNFMVNKVLMHVDHEAQIMWASGLDREANLRETLSDHDKRITALEVRAAGTDVL